MRIRHRGLLYNTVAEINRAFRYKYKCKYSDTGSVGPIYVTIRFKCGCEYPSVSDACLLISVIDIHADTFRVSIYSFSTTLTITVSTTYRRIFNWLSTVTTLIFFGTNFDPSHGQGHSSSFEPALIDRLSMISS